MKENSKLAIVRTVNSEVLANFFNDVLKKDRTRFLLLIAIFETMLADFDTESFSGHPGYLARLAAHCHMAKASCQSFGTECLGSLVEQLEAAVKANEIQRADGLFIQVLAERERALGALKNFAANCPKSRMKNA